MSVATAGQWKDLNISPAVLDIVLNELKFTRMTPVQAHTIPPFLAYKDMAVEVEIFA